jgi:hypothetical protein
MCTMADRVEQRADRRATSATPSVLEERRHTATPDRRTLRSGDQ